MDLWRLDEEETWQRWLSGLLVSREGDEWSVVSQECLINPRCACAARVTVVGFVCLSVCLSVCYSTSHLSNVCSSQKRYHLPNGRRRSENLWGFLWKCSVAKLERFRHCTASEVGHFIAGGNNSTGPACSVHLEGTTTHNGGRVSTPACYL